MTSHLQKKKLSSMLCLKAGFKRIGVRLVTILLIYTGIGSNQSCWAGDGGIDDAPAISRLTGVSGGTGLLLNNTAIVSFNRQFEQNRSIRNIITFGVIEETPFYIPANFTATIKIKIEYGPSAASLNVIPEQILTITYDKNEGVKYNAKNYFHFSGAEYVKITVTQAPAGTVGSIDVKNLLMLENEMRATRYYDMTTNVQAINFSGTAPASKADEFLVSWQWPANATNTHAQLEWTWVEDELITSYYTNGSLDLGLLFKNNSTRIDLPRNIYSYKIPLLYGGIGKVYYRVRAASIQADGTRRNAGWSTTLSQSFAGHNDSLNWQSTTNYSEEGKRKTVLSYYDGSLRNRQTVTKDNVLDTTIVSETFYDGQGRPAIQVLPAPGITKIIAYAKNLNRFNTTVDEDPAVYFDIQPVATPNSLVPPMITASGASQYYSAANPEKNNGLNRAIPDAEGYPYSVTRYTPDATGRIMAQSQPGAALQMGKGHETKYYYGSPSQEELDGLFGTEVGKSIHYFKNMAKDPNGQMVITYVDMHGRTIATALAGNTPANLDSLKYGDLAYYQGQANKLLTTRNLLDNNTNIVKGTSLEAINTILVPVRTAYQFRYELNPQALQLLNCSSSTICYDCMYNLEISITDESGDGATIVKKYNNISMTADDNCGTAIQGFKDDMGVAIPNNIITFVNTLDPGSYSIRKTLTLSEASLQKYRDEYLTAGKGICKTEQQLIDSVYSELLTTSDCSTPPVNNCTACQQSLGTYASFRTNFLASINNPNPVTSALELQMRSNFIADSVNCRRFCDNTLPILEVKRQLMLSDMVPYSGQYATEGAPSVADGTTMYDKYNIFSTASPATQPFYKKPWDKNKQADYYRTMLGTIDPVIHPGVSPDYSTLNTTSGADFTQLFNNSWAEALLAHHPEYNRLVFAETNLKASYDWFNVFSKTPTYAQAEAAGFIFTSATNLTADPFLTLWPAAKDAMAWELTYGSTNAMSFWQIAHGIVKCNQILNTEDRAFCYTSSPKSPPYGDIVTTEEKDRLWLAFRNLYMRERNRLVDNYISNMVPSVEGNILIHEKYILRFPDSEAQAAQQYGDNFSWYMSDFLLPPDISNLPGGSALTQVYNSRCSSYINQWRQSLLQCATLNVRADKEIILTQITNGMLSVCQKGSNEANPYGASNVAPAAPVDGSPRSFEEVIMSVFNFYGIAKDSLCNPFVIEFPKPYSKGPALIKDMIVAVDTCNCSRFTQLKNEATAAGKNPAILTSLNQYLWTAYADTLTPVLYNAMMQNCAGIGITTCYLSEPEVTYASCNDLPPIDCGCTVRAMDAGPQFRSKSSNPPPTNPGPIPPPNCRISCVRQICTATYSFALSAPQPLPDFLKCGFIPSPKCLNCAALSALTAEFKTWFQAPYNAGPVFSGSDLTVTNIRDNKIFQQFINYRTGFQYNWMEYTQAANTAGCNLANYAANGGATQNVICGDTKPLTDTTGLITYEPPCQKVYNMAIALAQNIYQQRKEILLANFEAAYRAKCMSVKDSFTVTYINKEYHYTLYYYDMAGNLVKTVPPKGVRPDFTHTFTNSVKVARQTDATIRRPHELATDYRYNGLNSVIAQRSPDADTTRLWYDRLGRLAVSRNAQQAIDGKYTYTLYDYMGRPVELGQKTQATTMSQVISQNENDLKNWILNSGGARDQITFTVYNEPYTPISGTYMTQKNLRNRVSYTAVRNSASDTDPYYTATFYTYDIHGNVDTLLQDYKGIQQTGTTDRFKRIAYGYDFISNKVTTVSYQAGYLDSFFSRYAYDAENRLVKVETSRDKIVWERDATYSFYKHGPLGRSELGQLKVQGLDYAYTLQGWLKGMNTSNISSKNNFDIGADGTSTSSVARDILGFALHYYDATENGNNWIDYKPVNNSVNFFARPSSAFSESSLYNNNIAAMTVNNAGLLKGQAATTNSLPLFYEYRYDQLNRLTYKQTYKGLRTNSNVWDSSFIAIDDYLETVVYDPNGNMIKVSRSGAPATGAQTRMDALNYNYYPNSNRLQNVLDQPANTDFYTSDIDRQSVTNNYTYDAIGNQKTDESEGITNTQWNIQGKIMTISHGRIATSYAYDAGGNRISESFMGTTTLYVRDAAGNALSIYRKENSLPIKQTEIHLYGCARLGIQGEKTIPSSTVSLAGGYGTATVSTFTRGEKIYEISNHLQNVMVTVSDKKIQVSSNGSTLDYYKADVLTAKDYYSFGMLMPGRAYNYDEGYRYGFNGKQNDNFVKGEGNQQDYGMRIYDPRLARFLSVDPLTQKFPFYSPYHYAGNSPIKNIDLDGAEPAGNWWDWDIKVGNTYTANHKLPDGSFVEARAEQWYVNDRNGWKGWVTHMKWHETYHGLTAQANYYSYFNTDPNLGLHPKSVNRWTTFETRVMTRQKHIRQNARTLAIGVFGTAVTISAFPLLPYMANTTGLAGTTLKAELARRLGAAGADAASQGIQILTGQQERYNVYSTIGAGATLNPFGAAAWSTAGEIASGEIKSIPEGFLQYGLNAGGNLIGDAAGFELGNTTSTGFRKTFSNSLMTEFTGNNLTTIIDFYIKLNTPPDKPKK